MLLSCDVCLCLCCLLSQVVAVSGAFRPVSSSALVVSRGAVAAERSPHVCEGELCGVSSPSVRPWDRPCLSSQCHIQPPVVTGLTKYGPLKPLSSSSLAVSVELSSPVQTLEEGRALSEHPLVKGECHKSCSYDSCC